MYVGISVEIPSDIFVEIPIECLFHCIKLSHTRFLWSVIVSSYAKFTCFPLQRTGLSSAQL